VTTERYDNQRLKMLQAAVARLEDGKDFDAGTDAMDKVQESFKFRPNRASPTALATRRKLSEVTERSLVGKLVPVRGFEPLRNPPFAVALDFNGTVRLAA
jgi:hypothetical protein